MNTNIKKASKIVFGMEEYVLVGFTVHLGLNAKCGHYVAYHEETAEKFDDLGGEQQDEYGDYLDEHGQVSREQLALERERGYIYLYKKVTDR